VIEEAKKASKIAYDVPISDVADLSMLRKNQWKLGISDYSMPDLYRVTVFNAINSLPRPLRIAKIHLTAGSSRHKPPANKPLRLNWVSRSGHLFELLHKPGLDVPAGLLSL
jgi:hypothetical protein